MTGDEYALVLTETVQNLVDLHWALGVLPVAVVAVRPDNGERHVILVDSDYTDRIEVGRIVAAIHAACPPE